jgi:alpha-tubulin suppressor-like RCC1 family protein
MRSRSLRLVIVLMLLASLVSIFNLGPGVASAAGPAPKAPGSTTHPPKGHAPQTPHSPGGVAPHGASASSYAAGGTGTAYGWGDNTDLYFCNGDFDYNDAANPSRNIYLSGVTGVSAGYYHALYLMGDGTVFACGYDGDGALGSGSNEDLDYGTPQQVSGVCPPTTPPVSETTPSRPSCGTLGNIVAIAAGYEHSLALDKLGNVYAWGDNYDGELGIGTSDGPDICQDYTSACSLTPVQVPGLTDIVAIAAGDYFSVALKSDGTVWAWGYNYYGELGLGTKDVNGNVVGPETCQSEDCSTTPRQVTGLTKKIVAIATGEDSDHVLALAEDSTVFAWGYNYYGQLGRGTTTTTGCDCEPAPALVNGPDNSGTLPGVALPDATHPSSERIGANDDSSYAVMADGTVYAWGYNDYGELGIGNYYGQPDTTGETCYCYTYPIHVVSPDGTGTLGNIVAVGSGGDETGYAIAGNGQLYAWGYGYYGQLGNGQFLDGCNNNDFCDEYIPQPVLVRNANGDPMTGFVAVSASDNDWVLALAIPAVSLSTNSLTFGDQPVGTTSSAQSITVTNTGGDFLKVSSVTLVGANAGDFTKTGDNCAGATVAAGTSCNISIAFAPTATGAKTATVTIADNAPGSPRTVTLSGNATNTVGYATVTASVQGNGTIDPAPGAYTYTGGTPATFGATPAAGNVFIGWTLNGQFVGFASPLTFTVNSNSTLVAIFAPQASFTDVSPSNPYYTAIAQLAARGSIHGYGNGAFGPSDLIVRAQSAAIIARTFGWDTEFHGNSFPDKCDPNGQNCIDTELWNDVGALNFYNVARGYPNPTTCQAAGTTTPCYLPRADVLHVQVISFITRAMEAAHLWTPATQDTPNLYSNVPASTGERLDLVTYYTYVHPYTDANGLPLIPGQSNTSTFSGYDQPATRGFVAQIVWQAYASYFGTDRVP